MDRIWRNVTRGDGCWTWNLSGDRRGYGRIRVAGKNMGVTRLVLADKLGRALAADEEACHTCDNPPCVRPDHLFPGSGGVNIADRHAKGRDATGDRHGTVTKPASRASGDRNGARTHPERLARGERSGRRLHPERYEGITGEGHWTHLTPERLPRGETHGMAKLTEADVREIRALYAKGDISQPALGRRFGVSHVLIGKVVRRAIWQHVA